MRWMLAPLALLLMMPLAHAQAPEPGTVVEAACAAAGAADLDEAIPLCPQVDPAAPAPADEAAEAHDHDAPANPQEALDLAGEAVDTVQSVPEDPAGAPEALAAFVATLVQFVKDLLGIPAALGANAAESLDALGAAAEAARDAVGGAAEGARDAVGGAVQGVVDAVKDLLARPEAPTPVRAPARVPAADEAGARVDGLLGRVTGLAG